METITLNNDIKVFYITAKSFPDGVKQAHEQLHALIPFSKVRKYFGLSRPENGGGIVYKAAAEEKEAGEAEKLGCQTIVIKKGKYLSQTINDFMKDIPSIGHTFQQLLSHPGLDPQGYCVEWYLNNKDVQCMIRLAD
jgi:predicted transcriptional regulator YdeE